MGTEEITGIVTGGLTMGSAWSLVIIAIVFMLAWSFKGFLLDILGWIWFKFSPFEVGAKIKHDTNSDGPVEAEIESASIKTLILRYPDDGKSNPKKYRKYIPMADVKSHSAGWVVEFSGMKGGV